MANAYEMLMAKKSREEDEAWLPLWMHLKDTAGVMRHLLHKWIPMSVVRASGMNFSDFEKTAVFTAAVHDIGKATSYFQSMIAMGHPRREEIEHAGYLLRQNADAFPARKTPHSYAGQWILQSDAAGIGVNRSVADVVGAHHGVPAAGGEADLLKVYESNFYGAEGEEKPKRLWQESWKIIAQMAEKEAGLSDVAELPRLNSRAQTLLSGLLITADWLASNTAYFPLISEGHAGNKSVYPKRIREGCAAAAFPEGWYPEITRMDDELFNERFGFCPNNVQKAMAEAAASCRKPGIFILEAQMGVGKTEAGLAAAELLAAEREAGGVFFGLPTQATSNGMFGRLYAWAEQVSEDTAAAIRLAHAAAEYNEEYEKLAERGNALVNEYEEDDEQEGYAEIGGLSVHSWFQGNKKALLADFVIGTVDQFLLASLKKKHFMLRHLGLAGKIVIIDECHAYDAYMNQYLDRTLEWMAAYGVPVILLSATLPAKRRTDIVNKYVRAYARFYLGKKRPELFTETQGWEESAAYPLLTWTDGEKIAQRPIREETGKKTVYVDTAESLEEITAILREALQDGGCACVIMNTVKKAQEAYEYIRNSLEDAQTELYHAQFTMPDRAAKEQTLLAHMGKDSREADRYKYVLVGTQVLEQSLDYDADILVTQLCPMDLLLQRIGRLHRHLRNRPAPLKTPRCILLLNGKENGSENAGAVYDAGTAAVYGDYLLLRTWQEIGKYVVLPDDIPRLVQSVYRESGKDEEEESQMADARREFEKQRKGKQERARGYLLGRPPQNIENILENADETIESAAQRKVRDGTSAIEVLLMQENSDGFLQCAGTEGQKECYDPCTVPNRQEGRKIARSRMRLPGIFSREWLADRTIRELEDINRKRLSAWQLSPWIKGELVLILDTSGYAQLSGYCLSYSAETGLRCEKAEERKENEN